MTPTPLILVARVQRHLVLAHRDTDDGLFAFVLCKQGIEAAIGQRLQRDTQVRLKVTIELINDEGEQLNRQAAGEPCRGNHSP